MKKIFFLLVIIWFVYYLYYLWVQHSKIEQAKDNLTTNNDKIKVIKKTENKQENKEEAKEEKKEADKPQTQEELYNLDNISYEKKLIWTEENGIFMWMPEGELFWQILSAEDGKVTYSKITDLIIEKKSFDKEQVSDPSKIWNTAGTWYLNENYNSYVYWNTLRNIDESNKEAWVSFYVLYKKDDKIIYEKLYFDFNHWLLGKLKLKEFEIQDDISTQMSELNSSLKEKNKDFDLVKKTDFLFKEIVR